MNSESMERNINLLKSIMVSEIPELEVVKALSQCNNNAEAALNLLLDSPPSPALTVHKTLTSTGGARISTLQLNPRNYLEEPGQTKSFDLEKVEWLSVEYDKALGISEEEGKGSDLLRGEEIRDSGFGENVLIEVSEDKSACLVEEKIALNGEKSVVSVAMIGLSKNEQLGLHENVHTTEKEERSTEINFGTEVETRVEQEPIEHTTEKEERSSEINFGTEVETRVKQEPIEEHDVKSVVLLGERDILRGKELVALIENDGLNDNCMVGEEKRLDSETKVAVIVKGEPDKESEQSSSTLQEMLLRRAREKYNPMMQESKSEVNGGVKVETRANEEPARGNECKIMITVKKETKELINALTLSSRKLYDDEYSRTQMETSNKRAKKNNHQEMRLSTVVIEDGDFPEDPDWLLVGRTVITGLSTTRGRKLENNEIVHFAFPRNNISSSSRFASAKAATAASNIVRFSTKRSGEIGRLPMEWAKCLVPLVNSSKVKVLGRCIAAPLNLQMMQEVMLYVSFYIHHSIFTECNVSSWKLEPTSIDTTTYPLLTLFKLLKVIPSQKAEFTPEEIDSRKRSLKLDDSIAIIMPLAKRIKGCQLQDQNKDEQSISESALNKLVGAVDVYNLEEMEPPETLTCNLRPYQKQALYWMSELESGAMSEDAGKTLHPCWATYRVCDERAPAIYVNIFSGEATTQFPTATQISRGGILADAMGMGKTVMTISLILARRGRGRPEDQQVFVQEIATEYIRNRKMVPRQNAFEKVKGGTLIICPMALLSQWKDELETHSMPGSISIFVHYGGDRSNDPKAIAEPDVVLTTYGVLTAAYKKDLANSIFHKVEWHRVVLDEAHTIKSSKTQGAQAAFALSSHCRWCLTGTPLQNNLEDLYSLLCFLHVEPWCNWAWWSKLIQRPYENGDQRGLKLVKAILRPLMLRRTKESKDKEGRPILVLPPTDIKVIECDQSEEEHDFYDALFKRSKVQFEQFVAQGKVLHNYANILELLLRLRQCCNHPFLVMSRGDTEKYADLDKLARRFLQRYPDSASQTGPSRAYVKEVVENLRSGENAECPICLESADDPVLTPCAHRMCRECLLSSWRTTANGICPICREMINKSELITCPSAGRFRVDVEKNWKESSKISKLLDCLEQIHSSGSGEKSIVFSQWTSFLDLLEIPLKRRNFGFLRFDGKLSQKQRAKVLHEFAETEDKMVLLMSLKAGGVGLNLTAASNVFLMDPWWNPAVEEQAIMRIHRIGQKKTVHVRRFIVKDTVEERLQQVQARKQRMVAGALTDDEVRSARLEELKMLFR